MKRDLRGYARQTRTRLILGGLALFFIVGEGLIFLIYGPAAAVTGLICMGAGLLPVILVIVVLQVLDWVVKKNNPDE